MFPTRLNLLPPDKQRYLQRMVLAEFTKSTLETALFLLCLGGIALLGGRWVLQKHFNSLTENIIAISNQHSDTNLQIKSINKTIHHISGIQDQYILWSAIIEDVASAIPKNVTLTSMTFDAIEQRFSFSGTALERADLLSLQEQLEGLRYIETITIPLSQLTQKINVPFTLSATVSGL